MNRRTIAIIGGGPAGSTAAEKLATGWALRCAGGGHRVLVFEEKIGWEKPCGGGLSHKALRRYPFLAQATGGGNLLHEAEFIAAT
ncbi:MAG TPA: NAD(P)-binding protein, partial [Terriglobia bacterium]|nr:NAD(P)-binding protein [Terriglobia bacterium]